MSQPELPHLHANASRKDLRKAMLRMRLEMHRQEIRHETLVMLEPLRKAKSFGSQWREQLAGGGTSLWITGGAVLLAGLGLKKTNWRRWIKIALITLPLLRRVPPKDTPQ
ncbi:hypothetical protein [Pseudomonas sp. M30-35]|uniref:hypothetical protein n=1 Tax=Pseudomonas sp. M30-35 TaxID=1981174 RepID=UPI000B3BFDD6|nr:hypothetical protein [Pseudomonas sp. M30-35]ARU89066.1 hypothetical protein B9K09_14290 [Pseudomonas sp. M30-35]